jgi:hypothetical protein
MSNANQPPSYSTQPEDETQDGPRDKREVYDVDPEHKPQSLNEDEGVDGLESPSPGGWDGYPLDELAIRDETRTAVDIVRRMKLNRFVLDPDFQRDFVWDVNKQSRLIESILMRIPLPVFYVAEDSDGRLIVVDGRQRLTTLQRFFDGKFQLQLKERSDLHGKRFSELEVRLQGRVEDCQLRFYIIDNKVPARAQLDIFERVNGGEVLTRQQMRNALYNGKATQFLKDEASTPLFQQVTGGSLDVKKMQDREFVNRFCSFSLFPLETYKGDMDEWLARGLKELATLTEHETEKLRAKFHLGLQNNQTVFGIHAFRKHRNSTQSRSRINAAIFDVMMAELSTKDNSVVIENSARIQAAFVKRMDDVDFEQSVRYGPNAQQAVRKRFEIASEMMREVFDAS